MTAARESAPASELPPPPTLEDKVSFLSTPESYHEHCRTVSVLQTSHAWVFLTEKHVFKLKKPYRRGGFEYSSVESRRVLCEQEYALNLRLASNTYLGVVPLVIDERGGLQLEGDGRPVEWLVKMNRLPESRMLLRLAATDTDPRQLVAPLMAKLIRFYRQAPAQAFGSGEYAERLRARLSKWRHELMRPEFGVPTAPVTEVTQWLLDYLDTFEELFEQRAAEGRVREVHGDLRPEHVFFPGSGEPEIIDCLEFDDTLRRLDCAEEIAFLGMECRHAGYEWLQRECIRFYDANSDDRDVPAHLWIFYATLCATIRSGLCAWHMLSCPGAGIWTRAATVYLQDARYYISQSSARG